jgi:vacuolar-type H+-ATPase subunit H
MEAAQAPINTPKADILKRIHETEREAERKIREAEARAKLLREEAKAEADRILRAKQRELDDQRRSRLDRALLTLEQEGRARLETARAEAEETARRLQTQIEPLVDRLLHTLLPLSEPNLP